MPNSPQAKYEVYCIAESLDIQFDMGGWQQAYKVALEVWRSSKAIRPVKGEQPWLNPPM